MREKSTDNEEITSFLLQLQNKSNTIKLYSKTEMSQFDMPISDKSEYFKGTQRYLCFSLFRLEYVCFIKILGIYLVNCLSKKGIDLYIWGSL